MEIEAKFALTMPLSPEHIEALDWGAYQLGKRHSVDQHDTFFDTPDLALSCTRHAVRLRTGGAALLVTLKGPGQVAQGIHSREEWEEATSDPQPDGWPTAIRERIHALIGTQAIAPLLTVHNQRRTWPLLRDDHVIGEVALDKGTIAAGDAHEPMHELEIELKGGTRSDLEAVCALVQQQLPVQPEDRSKFARGLALAQQARAVRPDQ
jgi:inorganic triphosphatase YgiF